MSGGRFAKRALDHAMTLEVPAGEPVGGRLASIAIYQDDGAIDVRVVFTLSMPYAMYEQVQDNGVFEVSLATTAPDAGTVIFWDDRPIDLELGLVPALANKLRGPAAGPSWATAATDTLEDVIDRLMHALAGTDPELPLNRSTSFRWLRVLQEQTISPGASVRLGLRSIYN